MGNSKKSFSSFIDCANFNGYELRESVGSEKKEDIDFVIWKKGETDKAFAVSVKNTLLKKSKKRKHLWGWVELRNRKGAEGWLYGKCTFVAYERKNDFVLLYKKDLREWIEAENVARWDLPFVDGGWQAAYRLYRRPETREAIFHLKISDAVKKCQHLIWAKE